MTRTLASWRIVLSQMVPEPHVWYRLWSVVRRPGPGTSLSSAPHHLCTNHLVIPQLELNIFFDTSGSRSVSAPMRCWSSRPRCGHCARSSCAASCRRRSGTSTRRCCARCTAWRGGQWTRSISRILSFSVSSPPMLLVRPWRYLERCLSDASCLQCRMTPGTCKDFANDNRRPDEVKPHMMAMQAMQTLKCRSPCLRCVSDGGMLQVGKPRASTARVSAAQTGATKRRCWATSTRYRTGAPLTTAQAADAGPLHRRRRGGQVCDVPRPTPMQTAPARCRF